MSFTNLPVTSRSAVPTNTDPGLYGITSPEVCGLLFFHCKARLGAAARPGGWMGMSLEDFLFMALSLHKALEHTLTSQALFNAVSPMLSPFPPSKFACKITALTDGLALQVPRESGFQEGTMYSEK